MIFNEVLSGPGTGWQSGEVLSVALRISLRDLNARFLSCLRRMPEEDLADLGFTISVARLLRATQAESMPMIATCPYALFDAAFRRHDYWRAICGGAEHARAPDRPLRSPGGPQKPGARDYHDDYVELSEMALFFAWHLANTNALATRLVLGMSQPTAELIRSSTLAAVAGVVQKQSLLVRPRWSQRTLFWRRLLAITPKSSLEEATTAKLVGIQLMATDEASTRPIPVPVRTAGRSPRST